MVGERKSGGDEERERERGGGERVEERFCRECCKAGEVFAEKYNV